MSSYWSNVPLICLYDWFINFICSWRPGVLIQWGCVHWNGASRQSCIGSHLSVGQNDLSANIYNRSLWSICLSLLTPSWSFHRYAVTSIAFQLFLSAKAQLHFSCLQWHFRFHLLRWVAAFSLISSMNESAVIFWMKKYMSPSGFWSVSSVGCGRRIIHGWYMSVMHLVFAYIDLRVCNIFWTSRISLICSGSFTWLVVEWCILYPLLKRKT